MIFVDCGGLLTLKCDPRHGSAWQFSTSVTKANDLLHPFMLASSSPLPLTAQRKKDLPDPSDKTGIRRLVTSHSLQKTLVLQRSSNNGRRRRVRIIASATHALAGGRHVWNAPEGEQPLSSEQRASVLKSGGDFYALDRPTRHPRRRVLLDDFARERECQLAIAAAAAAMRDDDTLQTGLASREDDGESVVICSPPSALQCSIGEGASRLVAMLCWRVLTALRREFGETRPLYLAGAMLTRTRPPLRANKPPSAAASGSSAADAHAYDYGAAHVDRANVSSYDYSAVLYLNTKGGGGSGSRGGESAVSFDGGDFAFMDESTDEVVEPRVGRLLLFASGFEHLHRVTHVTSGTRLVLAQWYTLNRAAGHELYPAHYELKC